MINWHEPLTEQNKKYILLIYFMICQHVSDFYDPYPPKRVMKFSSRSKNFIFEPLTEQNKKNILLVYFMIWSI